MKRFFALAVFAAVPFIASAQSSESATPQSTTAQAPTVTPRNSSRGATAQAQHHHHHKRGHRHHRHHAKANSTRQ